MKTISTQLSHFFENEELKRNLPLLLKFVALLAGIIVVFTVAFHFIMLYAEGESHSWVTGLYWTLTVMTTLGFGDVTFTSDIGRVFSVVVLITGVVTLLIMLPFAFIRFFYAPWLKAQIANRAPKTVPRGVEGHVIVADRDAIASGLFDAFEREGVPYVLVGPDQETASNWYAEGLHAYAADLEDPSSYQDLRSSQARLLFANRDDVANNNIVLTAREAAPDLPIAAVADDENAIDILELSGATEVFPLKRWLGEQLANRVGAHPTGVHSIGTYGDLVVAELPVRDTTFVGKTIGETNIRSDYGVNVVGVWERGPLKPANPSRELNSTSVVVVIGDEAQIEELYEATSSRQKSAEPVVVIGGGTVGWSAIRALHQDDVPVHLIEEDPERCAALEPYCADVFAGDASNHDVLDRAGISEAPAVLLTTNDDQVNMYLTSYCRHLNKDLRVVSRITRERNLDAIYRAGADYVLSYATLGVDAVMSLLSGREFFVLGEGVDLFARDVTDSMVGSTIPQSEIGALTGLTVVAIRDEGETHTRFPPDLELKTGMELLLVGSDEQLRSFIERFE